MNPYAVNAALLQAREAGRMEAVDPRNGGTINVSLKDHTVCVLTAGLAAETRFLPDPDRYALGQEAMLILTGITGANTITVLGLQGTAPSHTFTEDGTAIFKVSLETDEKIWFMVAAGSGSGTVADGDYGDIVVSGGGLVWTIDVGVVTYAKIQDVSSSDRILGRFSAGPGPIEEAVITDFVQSLLDDPDAATFRASIGAGTGDGTIGGSTGAIDNAIIIADGVGGSTVTSSISTINDTTGVVNLQSVTGEPVLIIRNADGTDGGFHFNQSNVNSQTTGNLFIGFNSGVNTVGGSATLNVGIGVNALEDLTTGDSNVAFGANTLANNQTGSNNVAIGSAAIGGATATAPSSNIAIGASTLSGGGGSGGNVAIGGSTLVIMTAGQGNVAIGVGTMTFSSGGSFNVAVGAGALNGVSGDNNAAVGLSALSGVSSGANNVGFGSNAGSGISTGSSNISIGTSSVVPSGTASNQLSIGNLIFSPDMTLGVVEIRRSTTPCCFFTYNTFTSTTNYERFGVDWVTNVCNLYTQKGSGGGTARDLAIGTDGTARLTISGVGVITVNTTSPVVWPDDVRQTFNPGTNNAGFNVGSFAGDPGSPSNGDLWYDSTANTLDARINGATVSLGAAAVGAQVVQGRLTTESGVPVSTADRTAQGTIYFTPYKGDQVRIYNGSAWVMHTFTERSLALSSLTTDKNYDVFIYDNAGTLTLELSAAWTNDTTRADALALQDGVYVKSGTTTRLWLGTIRTTGTATTEDSGGGGTTNVGGKRFIWNAYNQVPRSMSVIDTANTWNYNTATWRQANGNAGNQVEYVTGSVETMADATVVAGWVGGSNIDVASVAVGISSTTAPSGIRGIGYFAPASLSGFTISGSYKGFPGLGYKSLVWLEIGATLGTSQFQGDGNAFGQAGLVASILN